MARLSPITTTARYGTHVEGGRVLAHTDIIHEYQGAHYYTRYSGEHMPAREVMEEEDRFLERRHKRHA